MPEKAPPSDSYLDLHDEQIDTQAQRAQERMLQLQREQDQVSRQYRELEELKRKRAQFDEGKDEMGEKFTRALVVVEREIYDTQKRVELLHGIRESFAAHADNLDAINPKNWDGLDVNKELTKALSAVDDARAEYQKCIPKITPETDTDAGDPVAATAGLRYEDAGLDSKDFIYWLKAGFAFTLPLFAVGVILIVVLIAISNR
jgi:hypothetical protein